MPKRPISPDENTRHYESLEAFLAADMYPDGRLEIAHGLPIHLDWQDRGADTTVVVFTAAILRTVETVPVFSGRGITKKLAANVLLVSDPILITDDELTTGWYTGSPLQPNFQDDLARIIAAVAGDTRVVFFGASAGGFASLVQASRRSESTAVVVNPQSDISSRFYWNTYLQKVWGMEEGQPPIQTSVIDTYSTPVDAQVVYLQNSGDAHVQTQMQPFMEALHPSNRVVVRTPYLGKGHIAPHTTVSAKLLSIVCGNAEWDTLRRSFEGMRIPEVEGPD